MILHVYNDAKKGTLSAWSFPSRWVASMIGDRIELNEKYERFLPTKTDLPYINPYWHRDLLSTIAEADRKKHSQNVLKVFCVVFESRWCS